MSELDITKIIEGKRYNTLTATKICTYENAERCEVTSLYLSPNGRFFLAGTGGAMSRWSQALSHNGRGAGEGLVPVSVTEARDFAEAHAAEDTIAKFFEVEDA